MNRYIIQILLFIFASSLWSCKQDDAPIGNPDPSSSYANHTDTTFVISLLRQAESFNNISPDSVIIYADSAMLLSEKLKYNNGIALSHYMKGLGEWGKGNYENAITQHKKTVELTASKFWKATSLRDISLSLIYLNKIEDAKNYLNEAITLLTELDDKNGLALAYINYGLIESRKENFLQALSYYQKALKLSEETENEINKSLILNNLGVINQKLGMNQISLDYFKQAYEIVKGTNNSNTRALYLNNIANIYIDDNNYTEALVNIEKGLIITSKSGDKRTTIFLLANKGKAYLNLKQYDTALLYYKKALNLIAEIGVTDNELKTLVGLGKTYFKLKDYPNALIQLKTALKKATEIDDKENIKDACKLLGEIYAIQSDHIRAYDFMKLSIEMADSLSKSKIVKQFTQMEMQYDFDKQQYELDLAQQKINLENLRKIERKNFFLILFISGFILISLLVIVTYRSSRHKQKLNRQLEGNYNRIAIQKQIIENKNNDLNLLNETKDKLFSIIAHDLTNPFNIIVGFSEQLESNYDNLDEKKRKHLVEEINRSSNQVFRLLKNLLTWTHSQIGTIKIDKEVFFLTDFVNNSINPYLSYADNKGISVLNKLPDTLEFFTDKYTMSSIIGNLFMNAVKFTNNGGQITIWNTIQNNNLEINISDTGVGIAPERLEDIFQIAKNKSTAGTNNEKGTGLGLIICKNFATKNGGDIKVQSKKGEGSTFTIILPQAEQR
ncbi:MAG: tetratricopeptide repeat-containing sensor histidine kinase [Bacteroidetes bacterium]|nr:tetratricopeptide repeat-containing sensor histidine kinase [Bacteroidota bacterium]